MTTPLEERWLAHTRYRDPVDLKKLRFLFNAIESVGPAPLDILEVGCGSGNIARPLAWLGHRVLATDIDEASLEFMRIQGVPDTLELKQAGLTELPAGRRFHVIIASEVLEHVDDPARALDVFRGALLPAGLVLVTIPNGRGPWEVGQALSPRRAAGWLARKTGLYGPLKRALGVRRQEKDAETSTFNFESPHLQHFTMESFEEMVRRAGFTIGVRGHSDGPLTFFPGGRRISWLARADCRLVDRL
ncbi:MAG TPA: class I SAM-dependent methyltransferase, partial [Candidatus Eisenbacteria bacterium]